jgi:hypothetical protein
MASLLKVNPSDVFGHRGIDQININSAIVEERRRGD